MSIESQKPLSNITCKIESLKQKIQPALQHAAAEKKTLEQERKQLLSEVASWMEKNNQKHILYGESTGISSRKSVTYKRITSRDILKIAKRYCEGNPRLMEDVCLELLRLHKERYGNNDDVIVKV